MSAEVLVENAMHQKSDYTHPIPQDWEATRKQNAVAWLVNQQQHLERRLQEERQAAEEERRLEEEERQRAEEEERLELQRRQNEMHGWQEVEDYLESQRRKVKELLRLSAVRPGKTKPEIALPPWFQERPVTVLYAPEAGLKERILVRGLVSSLKRAGMHNAVWWDVDEGVAGTVQWAATRLDATRLAGACIVVMSASYMASQEWHWESKMLRARNLCEEAVEQLGQLQVLPLVYGELPEVPAPHGDPASKDRLVFGAPPCARIPTTASSQQQVLLAVEGLRPHLRKLGFYQLKPPFQVFLDQLDGQEDVLQWAAAQSDPPGWMVKPPLDWDVYDCQVCMASLGASYSRYAASFLRLRIDGYCIPHLNDAFMEAELKVDNAAAQQVILSLFQRCATRTQRAADAALQAVVDAARKLERQVLAMNADQLGKFTHEIFVAFDRDGSGGLSRLEMQEVLSGAQLDMPVQEQDDLMMEIDDNNDQEVQLDETYRLLVDLQVCIIARQDAEHWKPQVLLAQSQGTAQLRHLFQQETGEQLATRIAHACAPADQAASGQVRVEDFVQLVLSAGLSPLETKLLILSAYNYQGGLLRYEEFAADAGQRLSQLRHKLLDNVYGERGNAELMQEALQQLDANVLQHPSVCEGDAEQVVDVLGRELLGKLRVLQRHAVLLHATSLDAVSFSMAAAHMMFVFGELRDWIQQGPPLSLRQYM